MNETKKIIESKVISPFCKTGKFMCSVLDSIVAQTSLNRLSLFSQI